MPSDESKGSQLDAIGSLAQRQLDNTREKAQDELVSDAATVFNGELIELIDSIRRDKEQTIDHESFDTVLPGRMGGRRQGKCRGDGTGLPAVPGS